MLNNNLNGRGITIWSDDGSIYIEFKKDGRDTVGNYVCILSDGEILVGDHYMGANG